MLNLLRKITTKPTTDFSEDLSDWEFVDDDKETNRACDSRESGLVLFANADEEQVENKGERELLYDVTHFVNKADDEENEVEKKQHDVTHFVNKADDEDDVEEEDDVDDDDDDWGGEEEDLMCWKLKGRFGKQNGGKKLPTTKKMPCYYHARPKTALERRGKRLVW